MIIALTGQKGGVGKSTTAICLAVEAHRLGRRTLLVDADPQATARTWHAVATESGFEAPTVMAMEADMHERLPAIAESFDVVVVDCPPRHGDVQRSALMVADLALLPCGPTAADAWALSTSLDLVERARALRPSLEAAILIGRKQGRTALGKAARAMLEESGLSVLRTELGYRVAYQEALAAGQGVTTYATRDAASREIRSLFQELESMSHGQEESGGLVAQAAVA